MFSQGRRFLQALGVKAPESVSKKKRVRTPPAQPNGDDSDESEFTPSELHVLDREWQSSKQVKVKKWLDKESSKAKSSHGNVNHESDESPASSAFTIPSGHFTGPARTTPNSPGPVPQKQAKCPVPSQSSNTSQNLARRKLFEGPGTAVVVQADQSSTQRKIDAAVTKDVFSEVDINDNEVDDDESLLDFAPLTDGLGTIPSTDGLADVDLSLGELVIPLNEPVETDNVVIIDEVVSQEKEDITPEPSQQAEKTPPNAPLSDGLGTIPSTDGLADVDLSLAELVIPLNKPVETDNVVIIDEVVSQEEEIITPEPSLQAEKTPPNVPLSDGLGTITSTDGLADVDLSLGGVVIPLNEPVQAENVLIIDEVVSQEEEVITPETATTSKRKRPTLPAENTPPKKRIVNRSNWKAQKAKTARDSGQAHTSLRGKEVPAKVMGEGCKAATCNRHCHTNISEEDRLIIFNRYQAIKNLTLQWNFIGRLIKICSVKRHRVVNELDSPSRKHSYEYFLFDTKTCAPIQVCQTMFVSTLAIGVRTVRTVIKRLLTVGKISPDKRGKHTEKRRRMNPVVKAGIIAHIKRFPKVDSHYCRSNTRKKYLDQNLSVAKMHRLYLMERGNLPFTSTLRQYRDVFNSAFNLAFFKPKKDQCPRCLVWSYLSEEEKLDPVKAKEYLQHMENKSKIREIRKNDRDISREENSSLRVCTYDLQKVLYCPKGENGDFFYRRKLSCYDFTIYDSTKKVGYCYCWDETVGKRGSDEISSHVFSYIEQCAKEGVTDIHFYSDSCSGQNKNQFLFSMYYLASQKHKINIVHRWLERGHTQMECDSMHARIEKKTRNVEIFEPSQWWGYIRTAKVSPPQYKVKVVEQRDILSFRDLANNAFVWKRLPITKLREIKFDSANVGIVKYKTEYEQTEKELEILLKKVGRPFNFATHLLKPAYNKRIPLKMANHRDMMWYLEKNYVPAAHQAFYRSLPVSTPETAGDSDSSDEDDADIPPDPEVGAPVIREPEDDIERALGDIPDMSTDHAEEGAPTDDKNEGEDDPPDCEEEDKEIDSDNSDIFD